MFFVFLHLQVIKKTAEGVLYLGAVTFEHYFSSDLLSISLRMSWFWYLSLVLILTAVSGNALVIFVIISRRRLHTKTNWFVVSLAIADLFLVALLAVSIYICGTLIRNCGNVFLYLTSYFAEVSVTNIIALAVDRYFAIVLPLRYTEIMTKKKIVAILIISWFAPLVLDTVPTVLEVWLSNGDDISQLMSMIIFQISPCVVLTIAARKMITTAKKHTKRTSRVLKQLRYNQLTKRTKAEASSARLITVMVGVFLICYVSQTLSSVCSCIKSCEKAQPTEEFGETLILLLLLNSGANPFVYSLFKRDIKRQLRLCVKSRWKCFWIACAASHAREKLILSQPALLPCLLPSLKLHTPYSTV